MIIDTGCIYPLATTNDVMLLWLPYCNYRADSGGSGGGVKTAADTVDKWLHDCYDEDKQGPRTAEEKERVSGAWGYTELWG